VDIAFERLVQAEVAVFVLLQARSPIVAIDGVLEVIIVVDVLRTILTRAPAFPSGLSLASAPSRRIGT
jgi:hypothetical protein